MARFVTIQLYLLNLCLNIYSVSLSTRCKMALSKVHKYRNDWQTIVYNVHDKSCPAKLKMISMKGARNSWSSDELLCGINRTNYLSRRSKLDNIVTETDISVIEISFKLSYFLNYLYRSKTLMKQFCSSQM